MGKTLFAGMAAALVASVGFCASLSDTEKRWLKGVMPVVAFAREINLPLDIVVQPQPTPGAAPLAMAFLDGRCKLVFSMRANPEAQATLERIGPELLDAALELMAAHELGHCKRYLEGAWHVLPSGFVQRTSFGTSIKPELQAAVLAMTAARREEAFADLVGLAWIRQRHPGLYATLYEWLVKERSRDLISGSHHDTLVWLRRVADGVALQGRSIFAEAESVWEDGLGVENRP